MSVHLTTFKTPFGNNKAENQNLILAISFTEKLGDFRCEKSCIETFESDFWTCL